MQPQGPVPLPARLTPPRARCLVATLLALQAAALAQAPEPPPDSGRSLLLLIEDRADGARILSVSPKAEAFAERHVAATSKLTITLRDARGRALTTVDVAVPTNHGLCQLTPGQVDPNADRWLLPARVPDLGDSVAQVEFERTVEGARRYAMSVPGHELRAAAPAGGVVVQTIRTGGPTANRFDIVILGDGYLANQQSVFNTDAADLTNHLFNNIEPYRTYQSYFNVHTVYRASTALVTQNALGSPLSAYGAVLDNPVGMFPLAPGGLNAALADAIQAPDVETGAVLILANAQNRYGGIAGFNQYGMGTTNRVAVAGQDARFKFPQLLEHELGHAYANLHDEYPTIGGGFDSPANPDHPEANVTNRGPISFGNPPLKWGYWVDRLTPNYSFIGGAGFEGGIWHPNPSCMMNFLDNFHCPVCAEEIVKRTYSVGGVSAMINISPPAQTIDITDIDFVDLSYTDITPTGGRYEWWVDGSLYSTGTPATTSLRVFGQLLGLGAHTVEARLIDRTLQVASNPNSEFVRMDPGNAVRSTRVWTVNVQVPLESRRLVYHRGDTNGLTHGIGHKIALVGDLDLDGVKDYAYVSAIKVQIVSGATGLPISEFTASGSGWNTTPHVAVIASMNGDAYPEILIGTPGLGGTIQNTVGVHSGQDLGLIYRIAPTSVPANTTFGGDLVGLGRLDTNTFDYFAVAFEGNGPAVRVYASNNGSQYRHYAAPANASGAVTVTAIPDIDGDTRRDLVVSFARAGGSDVFVYSVATNTTLASFTQPGEVFESAAAVDIGDDGIAELIFGAPTYQSSRGRARILAIDLGAQTLYSLAVLNGVVGDTYYGRSVANAGDYDMDAANDFVVGAPGLPPFGTSPGTTGRIEIISGRTGGVLEVRTDVVGPGSGFGTSVANFGDINDDGLEDIAVGSPTFGLTSSGAVRVYSPADPTLSATTSTLSASAGGQHDLTIGMGSAFAGQSYLLLGSLTGTIPGQVVGDRRLPLIVDWYFGTMLGTANTGIYVATSGTLDANGVGSPSLVVSAGLLNGLAGLKAYHAALIMLPGVATATTNAVPLRIVQ